MLGESCYGAPICGEAALFGLAIGVRDRLGHAIRQCCVSKYAVCDIS